MSVCLSDRPSAKLIVTKTLERIKTTKFDIFICERCILGIDTTRSKIDKKIRMKFLTSVPYLRIRSREDFRSGSLMKVLCSISWCPNKIIIFIFFSFKNVDIKSNLSNFDANRTNIAEVTSEWSFCRNCILRYEVIQQVKLSYFSLLKVSYKSLTLIFDQFTKISEAKWDIQCGCRFHIKFLEECKYEL